MWPNNWTSFLPSKILLDILKSRAAQDSTKQQVQMWTDGTVSALKLLSYNKVIAPATLGAKQNIGNLLYEPPTPGRSWLP